MSIDYFTFEIFPYILTLFGLLSNFLIMLLFSRKKLEQVPSRNLHKLLAIVDFLNCLVSFDRIDQAKLVGYSQWTCKSVIYVIHMFPSISAWLLAYISIEKVLSITKPMYKKHLKKTSYQISVFAIICALNCVIFGPIFALDDIYRDAFNSTVMENVYFDKCDAYLTRFFMILKNFYLIQAVVVPFLIMFACSIYLVLFIFKSRQRALINTCCSTQNKRILKKDIQFAMQTLFLDILFICFNAPLLTGLLIKLDLLVYVFMIVFFLRFSLTFFIYFLFNSIFKRELLLILNCNC